MPKADLTPTTLRRSLLTGVGALGSLAVLQTHPSPDTALLAAIRRIGILDAETERLEDLGATHDQIKPLLEAWFAEAEFVVSTRATSNDGMLAKARLAHELLVLRPDGTPDSEYPSERIMWSVLRDLLT